MSQSNLTWAPLNFEITIICGRSTPHVESVTCPWLGEDKTGFCAVSFDFFAQVSDENSEVFGLLDIIAAPQGQFFDLRE
jgi:hypothetical protein